MQGITEPHPSFGFYTAREWERLKSLSPFSQKPQIKKMEKTAKARLSAWRLGKELDKDFKKEVLK